MKSLLSHKKKFVFGSFVYNYELIRQDRKSLSLTVTPDLNIILKSPPDADETRIELFLQKKWFWLEKQLKFFKKYQRKTYPKEYVSGESFLYLGRQYKLLVREAKIDKVSLTKGLFIVTTTKGSQNKEHTKKLLEKWYAKKTQNIFNERYELLKSKFEYRQMPTLAIRDMKKRWGSFWKSGKIILNPKLIHTPKDCIDYVITHELCHVKHQNHNQEFYAYLKTKHPQWKKTKDKLETIGI